MSVSSPCIKLCVIDQASELCQGCGRTLGEIARWSGMTEADRLAIMARLPQRLEVFASNRRDPSTTRRGMSLH